LIDDWTDCRLTRLALIRLSVATTALIVLSLGYVLASQSPADQAASRTAAISGVVMDGATKQPLAGALVSLSGQGATGERPSPQLTDARGRFVFLNLPPAPNYVLTADRLAYGPAPYARQSKPGAPATPLAVRDGEWISDLQVALWRRSAITGVVTDERGEPVADIFVRAIALVRLHGRDRLAAASLTATDDRGVYRLSDLTPGRYLVHVPAVHATVPAANLPPGVTPAFVRLAGSSLQSGPGTRLVLNKYPTPPPASDGRALGYAMTFHPSARALADAQVVSIGVGEDRSVDVRIEPVEVFRVSGRVNGPPESLTALTLRLVPAGLDALGLGSEAATALVAADGTFAFANVPSGAYTIDAPRVISELTTSRSISSSMMLPRPPGRGGWSSFSHLIEMAPTGTALNTINLRGTAPNYWGRTAVAVEGGDRTGVIVTMRPAGMMRGTVVAEPDPGRSGRPGPASRTIFLEPASPELGPALLQPDRTAGPSTNEFTIQGVLGGPYWLRSPAADSVVSTIMWKGRDYADVPFDGAAGDISDVVITVTNAGPVLTGAVRDSSGNAVVGASVLVFPADRAQWSNYGFLPARIKTVVTASNGTYRLASVPAGEYLIVATENTETVALPGPDFFQAAERFATRRTLAWGQSHNVDLVVSEVR
jgi:protocatechuate 3,4-dioxygenase beta subunit